MSSAQRVEGFRNRIEQDGEASNHGKLSNQTLVQPIHLRGAQGDLARRRRRQVLSHPVATGLAHPIRGSRDDRKVRRDPGQVREAAQPLPGAPLAAGAVVVEARGAVAELEAHEVRARALEELACQFDVGAVDHVLDDDVLEEGCDGGAGAAALHVQEEEVEVARAAEDEVVAGVPAEF